MLLYSGLHVASGRHTPCDSVIYLLYVFGNGYFGRLAFSSNRHGNNEIYVVRLAGGNPQRVTSNAADDWLPDWSPDGSRIAFTSNRTGGYDLWAMDDSGGGLAPMVSTSAWDDYARWAPGGVRLACSLSPRQHPGADRVCQASLIVRSLPLDSQPASVCSPGHAGGATENLPTSFRSMTALRSRLALYPRNLRSSAVADLTPMQTPSDGTWFRSHGASLPPRKTS